ncbi:MAG: TRAP transporter large permease [Candidatus Rokubacteria bacterium]|nr:TRAP transporter large permease [Candidatus Rokubacteria bacterium]
MEWYVLGSLLACIIVVLMAIGVPIGVTLGLTSAVFLFGALGPDRTLSVLGTEFFEFWTNYPLIAVPLFILMGEFLFVGGTADDIFDIASKWLQGVRGGLAIVTIGAGAIFGALSGSSLAAVSTFGILALPKLLDRGYDKRLAVGAVASAGGLDHLIPPSILMVLYASVTEVSVGKMLMAGFIPGMVLAGAFGLVIWVWVWWRPLAAPREPAVTWGERFSVLRKAGLPLLLVLAVLGSIYLGVATATEAAGIGALASLGVAISRRKVTAERLGQGLRHTIQTTAFIMLIAVGGKLLSWVLTYYLIPQRLVDLLVQAQVNRWALMIGFQFMYIVLGMFIDPVSMIIVTMPVLVPILTALHFDLIWFGILLMVNIEMALITPPVGFSLYIIKGLAPENVTFNDVLSGCLIFTLADVLVIAILMIFPELVLWLPRRMG